VKAFAALALLLALQRAAAAQADAFAPLAFLLGEWEAVETPAAERGAFAFRLAVQDHVIIRTNEAVYAATADRPASRHDDLMVIFGENGSLKADYFDNEGHVIRYAVRSPSQGVVTFVSDPNPREPRYRLTYRGDAAGSVAGSFEVAPPGSPDAFKSYLSWKARRRRP
jgi:predicted dehydrogenase